MVTMVGGFSEVGRPGMPICFSSRARRAVLAIDVIYCQAHLLLPRKRDEPYVKLRQLR